MKKGILIFILLFSGYYEASAQLDSIFWFGAPDLQELHGDRPILLRASTGNQAAVMTISIPANPSFIPIVVNIPANSSQSTDLTPFIDKIENGVPNTVQNKGIKITSTALISVYYDIANSWNGDIYPLKGNNALGYRFTLPFQMDFGGRIPDYKTSFVIVATEDDTKVTITPKFGLAGLTVGVPFEITLQKGQTYTLEALNNDPSQRPGGTVVEATKRIAISTKDDSLINAVCADTAGDQLIPDCNAGNEFAIMKGYLNGPDYYYVFGLTNNTSIKVNGTQVATINAGNYYKANLTDPSCYVETSQPVHLFHLTGFGCELGGAVLPSLINDGSSSISMTRASNEELFINILAPASIINSFTLNGSTTLIDASKFTAVPTTAGRWMTARINLPQSVVPAGGNFQVANTAGKFHAGMIHGGQTSTTRYGYFSDFARSNINLSGYDTLYCEGSSIRIIASGENLSNIKWKGPNGLTINGDTLKIDDFNPLKEGTYLVSGSDNSCGYVEKKVPVFIQKPKSDFIAPNNQCLTANSFQFASKSTVNYGTIKNILWDFGDSTGSSNMNPSHTYIKTGIFSVKLKTISHKGCVDSLTRQIRVFSEPIVSLSHNGFIDICSDSSLVLTATISAGEGNIQSLQWRRNGTNINGATNTTLSVSSDGTYDIEIINSVGCKAVSKSVSVIVRQAPSGSLLLPTTTYICQDSMVLLNASGGVSYRWMLNGITIPGANKSSYQADFPGIYSVEVISAYGCKKIANGTITLNQLKKPIAEFTADALCLSSPTIFKNLSDTSFTGPIKWDWKFGDGNSSNVFSPTNQYSISGTFIVSLKATSVWCPSLYHITEKTYSIDNNSSGRRYPAINAIENKDTKLNATKGGTQYVWIPSISLDDPYRNDPTFNGAKQTDYLIRYRNRENCVVVDSQLVRVFKDIDILVPKAFSPNDDGKNDKLEFHLTGIKSFVFFRVFNRWGQLLFETKDPKQIWDGKYKGVKQPLDTYIWIAEAISIDDRKIVKRGETLLIR